VDVETAGPTSGAVPKAGGAPGVGVDEAAVEAGDGLRHDAIAAKRAAEAPLQNRLRVFDMFTLLNRRIKAQGIVVQVAMRDLQRLVLRHFIRSHHFSESGRQGIARRIDAQPVRLL
jgi:hypothetical protein